MLLAFALAAAVSTSTNRVEAVAIDTASAAIRVSGEISEAVWQRAPAMDSFLQRDPTEGGEPSQRTEFRVVYDSTTLYVLSLIHI